MTLLLMIPALVFGILTGICLYRFYQNGWVPLKYIEQEKTHETATVGEKKFSTGMPVRQHQRKAYKAYSFNGLQVNSSQR